MKMNMILGKKQIMLSALVMVLGIAVYLNYQYSKVGGEEFPLTEAVSAEVTDESVWEEGQEDLETYGEAYFAEAKLSRSRSRDEAVEALTGMLSEADLDAEQRAGLAMEAAALARSIETEGKIENLIKAKGFAECMAYYDTEKVDLVVKTDGEGLSEEEVARMQDIVLAEADIPAENIRIVEVK